MDQPKMVKVDVIAEIYSLSESCIYSLARKGVIPSIRVGDSVRFDVDAVRNAIEKPSQKKHAR